MHDGDSLDGWNGDGNGDGGDGIEWHVGVDGKCCFISNDGGN